MKIKMDSVETIVVIPQFRIEATVYLHPASRFSDFANSQNKDFIPMTNAKVYDRYSNSYLGTIEFLAVNKNQVQFMYPMTAKTEVDYGKIQNKDQGDAGSR